MTHLAIGDYYYQRTYLAELQRQYPHLNIDIWIDDCRSRPKSWHAGRNKTLCQWLETEEHIHDIYPIAGSKEERNKLIKKAQEQDYDIIVFMARVRSENFAQIARKISAKAFIVGTKTQPMKKWLKKALAFRKLDAYIRLDDEDSSSESRGHINQVYRENFQNLFGLQIAEDIQVKELIVPQEHLEQMNGWLSNLKSRHQEALELTVPTRVVLINHLSTNHRRDLPWDTLAELLAKINKSHPECLYILNVPPAELENIQDQVELAPELVNLNIEVFTATNHFFQLPALIQLSDMVLTVETAIMHLASGLGVPQVVLMRKAAAHWCPAHASQVIYGASRVSDIPLEEIAQAMESLLHSLDE
ncbi:glycosyltransferase family 9 protein [Paraneptunicella aestuarii]|uniref:glycosyltransferase family 9 protein n=1 Tax=Paraneptunicella aestuarii TaxID=2831148 RepID=UPI001E34FAF7|nr:glycosyltransferase family 9 protein [Paraneptunicella aestuarii]UAA38852.1 glycosyltransferase family 9 protein [Paraneptunicella aestuarii]